MSIQNFRPIPTITVANDYWENKKWRFNVPEITVGAGATPQPIVITVKGIGALTLVNAIDEGLLSLTLFGATEQRNLPSEYTQVEYLESSGTQYINTGIIPTGDYTLIAKAKYNDLGSGSSKLFGSRNGSGSKEFIFTAGSLNGAVFTIGYGTYTITATGVDSDTNIHIFKLSKGTGYVDNAIAKQFPQESFTGDYPIYLFGANYAGTENGLSSTRFYYEEIYDGNDALVQNLIPCRRNSDSILGMYDTVTGNFLTNSGTGTFTAGADVVPTPDRPIDIVCNNGVLKVSPNLFNKNDLYEDHFIDSAGKMLSANTWDVSAKIPVIPNTQYTLSGVIQVYSDIWHAFYDSNDQCLLTIAAAVGTTVMTAPANASYLRLSIRKASGDKETVQLEQGSTATPYRPYGQIYTDGTVETVQVTGKNLFDYRYFYDNYQTYSTSAVGRCPIKLQPNTQYTVSANKDTGMYTSTMFVVSGSAIDWTPITSNNGVLVNKPRTVTTDSNGYLCFGLYVTTENAIPESYFINGTVWVQIEQGSTATEYEPYFNGGSATAEMLLKVGDYKDEQEVLGGTVTRNIGIKVFDGSEDWKATYQGFFDAPLPDHIASAPAYCNYFQSVTTGTVPPAAERANKVWLGSTWVGLGATTRFSTVNTFKQWLADQYANGTPVIIVYPLATATTETVTGQPLTTQAGTNIVEITQSAIDNLGLEVSYKQSTI